MTDPNLDKSEAWNYIVYSLLEKLEEKQPDWRSVTSTQFSKLPCIVDRYLIDELGRDLDFPRYWYKYGEVGNREPLNSSLYIIQESDSFGGKSVRPADTDAKFNISEDLKKDIDEAVDFIVNGFANKKADKVKEFQYEHFAPTDFIQEFEYLRDRIYSIARNSNDSVPDDKDIEYLLTQISVLKEVYPEDQYDEMFEDFQEWAQLMEEYVKKKDIGRAEAILEEFWEVFSRVHLRIEHNNNPVEGQIERWKVENELILSNYRDTIRHLASD